VRSIVSPKLVTGNVGDLKEVECKVTAAQAAADITWILNGRDITSDAHAEIRPNNLNGSFVTLSTLHLVLNPVDNGQELGCVVSHHTLADPEITTVPITVISTVEVSPQLVSGYVGALQEVECSVTAVQAAANITWTLDGRDITSDAHAEIRPNNLNGSFVTLSTLQHVLSPEDNGQELGCVVSHPTLADPEITTVPIRVCGGEYNSSSGVIRHPVSGDQYQNNEDCTWIIRAAGVDTITITFDSLDTERWYDVLTIR
ncbi:unnamed protein product, partial [Meganyctiphanes norvegica]